ncbi:MAG: hypothetical protein H7334_06925 [Ferruginibacter sp.]|nr:hypothetical protein [Ferruginibacter sp.]
MENSYTAYTKKINGTEFYFIKKYTCYPEVKNTPAILKSFGMHTNFLKACKIAEVHDEEIQQRLFKDVNPFSIYGYNSANPVLSTNLRVELVNNKPSLVSRLSGIKKIISAKMPNWRLLPGT